jgi:hypothetical protein
MVVPRAAHHTVAITSASAGEITTAMLADEAVEHAKLDHDGNFTMGNLTAALVTASSGVVTKHGTGADILIATLTAAFGDPAGLTNGSLFSYKDTVASKYYLVVVIGGAFYLEELTAAAAA